MTVPALAADWLGLCRRAADGASKALQRYPEFADRAATAGRGEGGDTALVIDRAVEDIVFGELEALGEPLTAVSEERGEVKIAGGGPVHVVVDPIDGSRNAKRGLAPFSLSIAVASGPSMGDVELGYIHDFSTGEDWWARAGEGACRGDETLPSLSTGGQLELVGLETVHPSLVGRWAHALEETGAARLRAFGSIAMALCYVAAGQLDALITLGDTRSVDTAAGQLIVREAGGAVAFPEADDDPMATALDLDMRSRVVAASDPALLDRLLALQPS